MYPLSCVVSLRSLSLSFPGDFTLRNEWIPSTFNGASESNVTTQQRGEQTLQDIKHILQRNLEFEFIHAMLYRVNIYI